MGPDAVPVPLESWSEVSRAPAPFAGRDGAVVRLAIDGRPVFGGSVRERDGIRVRDLAGRAAPWPRQPVTDAADRVARLVPPGSRLAAAPIEGYRATPGGLEPVLRVHAVLPGPAAWAFDVSAVDGRVVRAERTSREAVGRVYEGSPFTSGTAEVALPGIDGEVLDGPRVRARSCDRWTSGTSLFSLSTCDGFGRHAVADEDGDFVWFPSPASYRDPFAEVTLYWHADRFVSWMDERYGLRFPFGPIWANANFPLANAFFGDFDLDGIPEVSFGTHAATGTDFAYDADVVYHELGHGVVSLWAPDLPFVGGDTVGLDWTGGSINEGFADVFSLLHEPDPLAAEYAGSAFGERAIRDLSSLRRCPDDLVGEVHADGMIVGSLGWALVSDPAVGPDAVSELLAGTIPALGPGVDWARVGEAFHEAADELHRAGGLDDAGHAAVLAHLAATGMEGCERVIPLDDGRRVHQLLINGGLLGPLARLPGGAQFSIEVPPRAQGVVVDASRFQAVEDMGFAVYGRWGEPVGHEFVEVEALGLGFATPAAWDFVVDSGPGDRIRIPLGGYGPELHRGETLYLSVATVNLGTMTPFDFQYASIDVSAEILAPPGPPTGVPGAEPAGCATAPVGSAGWGALVALALAGRRLSAAGARAR